MIYSKISSALLLLLTTTAVLIALCSFSKADFPVHCEYPQIKGDWRFYLSDFKYGKDVVHSLCQHDSPLPSDKVPIATTMDLALAPGSTDPNFVQDLNNKESTGTWTLIYDQGFEVELGDYKFFAFFNYTQNGDTVVSNCYKTFTGWYHKKGLLAPRFGCFRAVQTNGDARVNKQFTYKKNSQVFAAQKSIPFKHDQELIEVVNKAQKLWTAGPARHIKSGATVDQVRKMSGAIALPKFRRDARAKHMKMMKEFNKNKFSVDVSKDLPQQFDWRNVDGKNYVSPVRNQQSCGSCYAFAATAMFEARLLVQSQLTDKTILSPQEIVSCSAYSQGCEGGFPYLISKYAQDFGILPEVYAAYNGSDGTCPVDRFGSYARYHVEDYYYVNQDGEKGYYGSTTEEGMMKNILKYGPISVSFEVHRDFMNYHGGIYKHVEQTEMMAPEPHFVVTNHVVLVVGWGVENGTKYWLVKNSWGTAWGIDGYFKIVRGEDECGIESLVPSAVLAKDYQF